MIKPWISNPHAWRILVCASFTLTCSTLSLAQTTGDPHTFEDAAGTQLIGATAIQQMLSISSTLGFRMKVAMARPDYLTDNGERYGLAAGGSEKLTLWSSLTNTDKQTGGLGQDTTATVIGADYALTPALLLGASLAHDRTTGTLFNAVTTGYTFAPYLGWQIDKTWALDATLGFGEARSDFATARLEPDRAFHGANLSYTQWTGNWQLTGKLSYLHGEEKYASTFINTKNEIDQWRLGGQISYWINGGLMPFAALACSSDRPKTAITTGSVDNEACTWSAGTNFISLNNNLTGGLVYHHETARTNSKSDVWMLAISYRF